MVWRARPWQLAALTGCLAASLQGCGGDERSTAWDDLSGTIYYLGGTTQDSVFSLKVRGGEIAPVLFAPRTGTLAAAVDGSYLLLGGRPVVRLDLPSGQASFPIPDADRTTISDLDVSPSGELVSYTLVDASGIRLVAQPNRGGAQRTILGPVTDLERSSQAGWLDDETLVFLRVETTTGLSRTWTAALDGTGLRPLGGDTGAVVDALAPARQARRLMVVRRPTGTLPDELWEMDAAGELLRRLAVLDVPTYPYFAWSPDAQFIALCLWAPTSSADIFLLHVDSGEMRRLTSDPGYECNPVWVP